jgi:hypothetical protein
MKATSPAATASITIAGASLRRWPLAWAPIPVNLDYYHLESNDTPDSGIPYSIPTAGSAARTKSNPDKPNDGGDSSNFYGLDNRDFRKAARTPRPSPSSTT